MEPLYGRINNRYKDKYDTVEKLLKLKSEQYVEFLKYIVGVIINRNKQLQGNLQEKQEYE